MTISSEIYLVSLIPTLASMALAASVLAERRAEAAQADAPLNARIAPHAATGPVAGQAREPSAMPEQTNIAIDERSTAAFRSLAEAASRLDVMVAECQLRSEAPPSATLVKLVRPRGASLSAAA